MTPLHIVGHGAVTAVGLDAPRTVASFRAGMDNLTELPITGIKQKDLRAVPVEGFASGLMGTARIEALAARALSECMPALLACEPREPVVFVGLPSASERAVDPSLDAVIRGGLERRFGLRRDSVQIVAEGRTSVFKALRQADTWLGRGARACIVGGADSLLDPATLTELSGRGLLMEEYDGFFPGEAAAFLCVSRTPGVGPWGRDGAGVTGLGEAIEPAQGSAESPLVGVGHASAMRQAMRDAGRPESSIDLCINAVNGSRAEFEDAAMAQVRFFRAPRSYLPIWHVASHLGETGAAFGAIALLWANAVLELGLLPARGVLLTCGAGMQRGAAFVEPPAERSLAARGRAGPAIASGEPVLHTVSPVVSTAAIADDPGFRISTIDDRHRALAESNFDELAGLLTIRSAHFASDSRWTDIEDFERRALAHLDALAWSADSARTLVDRYLDGEPEEAGAATLALCSLPGDEQTLKLLLEACASKGRREAIASSAALSPRGVAEQLLHRLYAKGGKSALAALRGLTVAQWLAPDWVESAACRLVPEHGAAFVVALGTVSAVRYAPWAVSRFLAAGERPTLEPTLATMALEPPPSWFWQIDRAELLSATPEALAIGCLFSGHSVVQMLGEATPTRARMIALGWSGEVEGTPQLLAGLEAKDEQVAREASFSLARMYGIWPVETVAVTEDEEGDGDLKAESGAVHAPGLDTDAETETTDRLSRSRPQWEEALRSADVPADGRIRAGRRWSKLSALHTLVAPSTPCSERAVAVWEYAIINRTPLPVHPHQWIGRQRRRLEAVVRPT